MRERRATSFAESCRKALGGWQIVSGCEFFARQPFEVLGFDIEIRRIAGARSLTATLAMAVRKLLERWFDTIGYGATEATTRQRFADHNPPPFSHAI